MKNAKRRFVLQCKQAVHEVEGSEPGPLWGPWKEWIYEAEPQQDARDALILPLFQEAETFIISQDQMWAPFERLSPNMKYEAAVRAKPGASSTICRGVWSDWSKTVLWSTHVEGKDQSHAAWRGGGRGNSDKIRQEAQGRRPISGWKSGRRGVGRIALTKEQWEDWKLSVPPNLSSQAGSTELKHKDSQPQQIKLQQPLCLPEGRQNPEGTTQGQCTEDTDQ